MRTQKELTSFIVLRSNGWSLAKISKHLNIPKTTLFRWEQANAETIHLFKYDQLEKIQEQYVPSYEEQLKDTHDHLQRIQDALKQQDYSKMSPEFLLQMNFQLQTRLDKIRQQVPLPSPQLGRPMEALPPVGCVTKDEDFPHQGDLSDPDPTVEEEDEPKVGRGVPAQPPSAGRASVPASQSSTLVVPPSSAPDPDTHPLIHPSIHPPSNGNGRPHLNGNGNGNGHHRS